MSILEIITISYALSLDAFTVAMCKGLYINKNIKKCLTVAIYFGLFQALMPVIGYIISIKLKIYFVDFAKLISVSILGIIGIQMLKEGMNDNEEKLSKEIDFKTMLPLAIATSIDALAVGVSFSFLNVNISISSIIIGIITFINSFIAAYIGKRINNRYGNKSLILGGIILIILAIKTIID